MLHFSLVFCVASRNFPLILLSVRRSSCDTIFYAFYYLISLTSKTTMKFTDLSNILKNLLYLIERVQLPKCGKRIYFSLRLEKGAMVTKEFFVEYILPMICRGSNKMSLLTYSRMTQSWKPRISEEACWALGELLVICDSST